MLRELDRLRRVADWLSDDLNRRVPQEWSCRVEDDYVLVVRTQEREERVALDQEVAVADWPVEAWAPEFRESTLDDDACEMLTEEVGEVLRLWDIEWPTCTEHGRPLGCCSSVWFCNGPAYHDVAPVGQLQV